ncbi:hypothetical protein LTR36_008275 [Oleoguttula mirabilis]|uniref:Uncharacterized protein n=1 Tax=Oleoguttula mirabilis TaxID=1507867 RepID=A0AAV9J8N1_9PEZI|nr:hypothetical protein LTR36_008275 [Oleoguttula mirabilis]
MAFLKKLRRSSKDAILESQPGSRHDGLATQPSLLAATDPNRPSFFDLPAEIRNAIYELHATDVTLSLPVQGKERSRLPPRVSALLLASRQCRKEYLPLLYSTAPVAIEVRDFEFSNVMRVVSSLYSTELKAFRENPNLVIRLRTQNCTRDNLNALRRWLVKRADSLDRLPWRYEVAVADPNGVVARFRLIMRELEFYAARLARLQVRLEDTLQWELEAIIGAFDRKAEAIEDSLDGRGDGADFNSVAAVRGLAGGGIH